MSAHPHRTLVATPRLLARALVVVALALVWPGCRGSASHETTMAVAATQAESLKVIDHLAPARDSVGKTPRRFEWTPVAGADKYAIGIWNEVDQIVLRRDDLTEPHVEIPEGYVLDAGTYFWSVTAVRDGRAIGDSGLSAFVVRE